MGASMGCVLGGVLLLFVFCFFQRPSSSAKNTSRIGSKGIVLFIASCSMFLFSVLMLLLVVYGGRFSGVRVCWWPSVASGLFCSDGF